MASRAIVTLSVLYVFLFGALGAEISFLPYLLTLNGLSAAWIGLVLSVGMVVQVLVAPVLGLAADRFGIRLVLGLSACVAAASFPLFLVTTGAGQVLIVYALFAASIAPLNPLADALSVPACLQAGVPYGRIRGLGSVGFLLGVVVSSALTARYGVVSIVPMTTAALALVAATVATVASRSPPTKETTVPSGQAGRTVRALLANPEFLRILLLAALVIGSHAMSDAFAVIHWAAIGIDSRTIGLLLAIAVGSEIIVFVVAGPLLLARLGASACISIGAVAGILRWTLVAEAHGVWLLLAAQLMHGLTFSLVHLALMQVLARVTPRRSFATAQSLYGICGNAVASGLITLFAGAIFSKFHEQAFLVPALLCGLAFPIALRLPRPCSDTSVVERADVI